MVFHYSDALLLEAIKLSQDKDKGATVTDIIKYADYINHAIMTYSEFITGTKKLKSIGLISERNKRLQTTDKFEVWWTKKYEGKSRFGLLKTLEEIKKYLNKDFGALENSWDKIKTRFNKSDLDKSTADYLNWANKILESMDKDKKKRRIS